MIEQLYIKNYLYIKEVTIEFKKNLNVLTGETGAGKTLILDAVSLLFGERADYSIIKNDQEKLIVEGVFNIKNVAEAKEFLKTKLLINEDIKDHLIVRKELSKKGISRNFINDVPVSISDLKELGDIMVDIHSQNEHQSLLKKEYHLKILDEYSDLTEDVSIFYKSFENYKNKVEKYHQTSNKKKELEEKKDFLKYQLDEILKMNLQKDEDIKLEEELKKLENFEDIVVAINKIDDLLYSGEQSAYVKISTAIKEMRKIIPFDSNIAGKIQEVEMLYEMLKEVGSFFNIYKESLSFEPEKIEVIRERLSKINFFKKKYKSSITELLLKIEEFEKELSFLDNFDFEVERLEKEINKHKQTLITQAEKLSERRKKFAQKLSTEITGYLKEVGLENADFTIMFLNYTDTEEENTPYTYNKGGVNIQIRKEGIDNVEFFVRLNQGSEYFPLRKTVSGGEISRIMLAIKATVAGKGGVPILIFDEVDTGISGRIASKVGKVLRNLSTYHQIIAITHLPQIAAQSTNHFNVVKNVQNNETIIIVKHLTHEEKILEIAKMISGQKVTNSAIESAKELIEKG
ncbi:MAG: DNA repair protein RecN [Ignavibacteria bacterium]